MFGLALFSLTIAFLFYCNGDAVPCVLFAVTSLLIALRGNR